MDSLETKRRFSWIEQIITNLELEGYDHERFEAFNNQRLQYLARRSSELTSELREIETCPMKNDADTSREFKAKKLIKQMKDSLAGAR